MLISRIRLKNWRNFRELDVPLRDVSYLLGPNASGKSNFLDVFRFLRDVSKPRGGGLQTAIADRDGISKLRCLHARRDPEVEMDVELSESADGPVQWRYLMSVGIVGGLAGGRVDPTEPAASRGAHRRIVGAIRPRGHAQADWATRNVASATRRTTQSQATPAQPSPACSPRGPLGPGQAGRCDGQPRHRIQRLPVGLDTSDMVTRKGRTAFSQPATHARAPTE